MDISEYWKAIKKQSKELTGVEKINAGLFHGSGVGGELESYIKAVKGGDKKKIMKAADKAHAKLVKYHDTIHKKEVAKGKKALKPAELKSAKIVGDAIMKILVQLNNVIHGNVDAGSFDGDGSMDAKKSADPLDKNLEKDAENFVKARIALLADAKGVLEHYKKLAKPVDGYLKLGKRGVDEAKKAKAAGKTFENQQGVDIANRAADEVEKILAAIRDHDAKVVRAGSGKFMKLRGDYAQKGKLPKWYVGDHTKRGYDAWKKVEAVLVTATDFMKSVEGSLGEARALADTAESYSMRGADPEKQLAKLKGLPEKAKKLFGDVELEIKRIKGLPDVVGKTADMDPSRVPVDQKLKTIAAQGAKLRKSVERVMIGTKTAKNMRQQVEAIGSRSEDQKVDTAVNAVLVHLDKLDKVVKTVKADTQAGAKSIADARIKLSTENV